MYAIVSAGGKQLKVAPGDIVRIENPSEKEVAKGDLLALDQVIFVGDGESYRTGKPLVAGASVKATVMAPVKTRKVLVFKKKRRKQYRRTKGHRQQMVDVRIDAIEG